MAELLAGTQAEADRFVPPAVSQATWAPSSERCPRSKADATANSGGPGPVVRGLSCLHRRHGAAARHPARVRGRDPGPGLTSARRAQGACRRSCGRFLGYPLKSQVTSGPCEPSCSRRRDGRPAPCPPPPSPGRTRRPPPPPPDRVAAPRSDPRPSCTRPVACAGRRCASDARHTQHRRPTTSAPTQPTSTL